MQRRPQLLATSLGATAALTLGACGSAGVAGPEDGNQGEGKRPVIASFYPLAFATAQIGGDHVAVTSLTRPGIEPHDIELTPRDVALISKAKLVVYERGLQGAVDTAVESQAGDRALDVAPAAKLELTFQPAVGAPETSGDNVSGTTDPHFWLDPQRYSDVAKAISKRLSSVDPSNKASYERNGKAFESRLRTLDEEFRTGLANCQRKDLVTSHAAFGYLAARFAMKQIAINGLSPEQEPKAATLASVISYARTHHVTTIYAEALSSPAIAETVAQGAGARIAVLDPIEGLSDKSSGRDYFEIMRSNLKVLRAGQDCS
jgi:zinc transport system substrate-binding protein